MSTRAQLSREEEVLVLCARVRLEPVAAERLDALLKDDLDWGAVEARAGHLHIAPLLARHLATGDRQASVPAGTVLRLREAHHRQSIRVLRLLGHADRIVDALDRGGAKVILLKGALLAGSLYPDPALRPMGDIDLLCRIEDAPRARETLSALGFSQPRVAGKSARHERLVAEIGNHLPAFSNGRGVTVEVHIRLFPRNPHAEEILASLWRDAVPHAWHGRTVLGFAPEDQLAYLALHLHRHLATLGPLPLYWWCDLHELIRAPHPSFRWDRFHARVDSLGARAEAGAVFRLLSDHWGTPVPADVLGRLGVGSAPIPLPSLLRGTGGGPDLLVKSRLGVVRHLAATGGGLAIAAFLFRVVWPSRAFIVERYRLGRRRPTAPYRLHFAGVTTLRWLRTALLHVLRTSRGGTTAR